jgi:hypothetical protein
MGRTCLRYATGIGPTEAFTFAIGLSTRTVYAVRIRKNTQAIDLPALEVIPMHQQNPVTSASRLRSALPVSSSGYRFSWAHAPARATRLVPAAVCKAYRTSARRGGLYNSPLPKTPRDAAFSAAHFLLLHRYVREAPFFRISKETEYGYIRIERLQRGARSYSFHCGTGVDRSGIPPEP